MARAFETPFEGLQVARHLLTCLAADGERDQPSADALVFASTSTDVGSLCGHGFEGESTAARIGPSTPDAAHASGCPTDSTCEQRSEPAASLRCL